MCCVKPYSVCVTVHAVYNVLLGVVDKLVGFYKLFNYSLKYDWGAGVGVERFLGDEWVGFLNTDSSIYPVDETVNNHSEVWFGGYKHSTFYFLGYFYNKIIDKNIFVFI